MNLQELSIKFYSLNIQHTYNAVKESNKLYLIDNKYTIILNTNKNNSIFIKVWKKWDMSNPLEQQQKYINSCRLIKYKILKKLHKINAIEFKSELML